MAKELIATKIIIDLDRNGDFDNGLLVYRIKENGVINRIQFNIGIKNMAFSKLNLASIIGKVIDKAKEQEGISNG